MLLSYLVAGVDLCPLDVVVGVAHQQLLHLPLRGRLLFLILAAPRPHRLPGAKFNRQILASKTT